MTEMLAEGPNMLEVEGETREVHVSTTRTVSVLWGGWWWQAQHTDADRAFFRLEERLERRDPFHQPDAGPPGRPDLDDGVPADIDPSVDPRTRKRMMAYAELDEKLRYLWNFGER